MQHSLVRRAGVLLASGALTVTGLALLPTGAAQAVTPYDPAPAGAGADWLVGQLDEGAMVGAYGPDYGLSIDTALGLASVGGHDSTVGSISDALAAHVNDYITGEAYGDAGSTYAGPTAKALVLAQTAGDDATTFGGVDLVQRLEQRTTVGGITRGRIADESGYGDYANVIGQSFAARGLAVAGSGQAGDAIDFLLKQQCGSGYFRLGFANETARRQRCVDGAPNSAPDTDVTALAMINLASLASTDPDVVDALNDASAWLDGQQGKDGSFGGGTATETANSNSTGLAGWALGTAGQSAVAERAAIWVRQHQNANVGACTPFAARDLGAIAYDDAAAGTARGEGIDDASTDQFRRATAQALPVLAWAPVAPAGSGLLTDRTRYYAAGETAEIQADGQVPGTLLCATWRGRDAFGPVVADGTGSVIVRLRNRTGERSFDVENADGSLGTSTLHTLGRLEIPFRLDRSVPRGERQVVRVTGLAPQERVKVKLRGRKVAVGRANDAGRFVARFAVTGKPGRAEVTVVGQFPDLRSNSKTFRVTR